jgi:hypothetical protein
MNATCAFFGNPRLLEGILLTARPAGYSSTAGKMPLRRGMAFRVIQVPAKVSADIFGADGIGSAFGATFA